MYKKSCHMKIVLQGLENPMSVLADWGGSNTELIKTQNVDNNNNK